MASAVYNEETIVLQDGKEVVLRPLPIGALRRFMEAWGKFSAVKTEDDGFTVFINCSGIALEKDFKEDFTTKANETQKKRGEFLSPEYKEYLEDVLDLETIYKVLEVCGGINLNIDPKVMEEAMREAQENNPGTT